MEQAQCESRVDFSKSGDINKFVNQGDPESRDLAI